MNTLDGGTYVCVFVWAHSFAYRSGQGSSVPHSKVLMQTLRRAQVPQCLHNYTHVNLGHSSALHMDPSFLRYPKSSSFVKYVDLVTYVYLWCTFISLIALWTKNFYSLSLTCLQTCMWQRENRLCWLSYVSDRDLWETMERVTCPNCFHWVCPTWPPTNLLCLQWEGKLSVSWETALPEKSMNRFFHLPFAFLLIVTPLSFHYFGCCTESNFKSQQMTLMFVHSFSHSKIHVHWPNIHFSPLQFSKCMQMNTNSLLCMWMTR